MIKKTTKVLAGFLKNRIAILFAVITVLFSLLIIKFYDLQILQQEQREEAIRAATMRTIPAPPLRGEIYDRFGRPLAVNKTAFCIKMDLSISVSNLNEVIGELLKVLESNHEAYEDELPITKSEPFAFTFRSSSAEKRWKRDMGFKEEQLDDTASEVIDYLRDYFEVSPQISNQEARKLIAVRTEIFLQRYRQYESITLAKNISDKTIAVIEEQHSRFPSVYIDAFAQRYYPEGENTSHILGYIGTINDNELTELASAGYAPQDVIGKLGIEKAYESLLRGKKGEEVIEVDPEGKRIKSVQTTAPQKGKDVYLTIDSKLQKKTAQLLRENLKEVLIQKMDSGQITSEQLFVALVKGNMLSVKKIMESGDDSVQGDLKRLILSKYAHFDAEDLEQIKQAKEVIAEAVTMKLLQPLQIIVCLAEQKAIACDQNTLRILQNGNLSPYQLIRDKILADEIGPSDMNLDPCTGSVAVMDVHTGEVLALVSYPSYDNNKLVNQFDNEYYQRLLNDPTTPLINRPLMERKAPGSILKMMTAVAGLESGIISKNTTIEDQGVYQKAGLPYAKCLIYSRYGGTHGPINVSKALEVSCNYFFYEVAYRMGNEKDGNTLQSIGSLDKYMKKFGLNDYSGIEIEELRPKMASPEAKKAAIETFNEGASDNQKKWMDGDSIRCAIGQSYNSFSVIHIAKYITALANGGTRYKVTVVKGTKESDVSEVKTVTPTVEENLHISPQTLEAVYEGMLGVTTGSQGTLRRFFNDFPIKVAAKTGTAEEAKNRPSHSWFVGFAPYDQPQIAVVVMIPFGEIKSGPATKIAKEIISEYLSLKNETRKEFVNSNAFLS